MIPVIRKFYNGKILYCANWGNVHIVEYWDLVDFIGVDAYYPIAPEIQTPTVKQIFDGWETIHHNLKNLSNFYQKKIIFSEIGYCSVVNSNAGCNSNVVSDIAQANCYTAALERFLKEDFFEGIFWWAVITDDKDGSAVGDTGFTPRYKLAQNVLKKFYLLGKKITKKKKKKKKDVLLSFIIKVFV